METERMIAVEIMDVFEEFLTERGVQIPSIDREGLYDEACIYGSEYYGIEDRITDTLKSHKTTFTDEAVKAVKQTLKEKVIKILRIRRASDKIIKDVHEL